MLAIVGGSNLLYTAGRNDRGQLGLTNTTDASYFTQVSLTTDVVEVSAGELHSACIKNTNQLFMWGANEVGQLAQGNTTDLSYPAQVSGAWSKVSCGWYFTAGIKSNGTLWAWGDNTHGQLGVGDSGINRSSPIQVGSATDWLDVVCGPFYTIGIRGSGTTKSIWAWGNNTYGQLGDGSTTSKSSPVQIGTLTNWDKVSAGGRMVVSVKQ